MMFVATAAAVAAARAMETTVSAVAATAATEAPTATETEAVADVGSLNVCSKAVITIVWILAIHKSVLAIHKSVLAIHKSVLHKSVFRTLDVVHSNFYSGSCQASFSGIRFFSAESAEFHGTHVGIKSFQGKIYLFRNPMESGIPAGILEERKDP